MKKSFYIYWGENRISCFVLKSEKQAKSIAKQYPNVTKIECKIYNKKSQYYKKGENKMTYDELLELAKKHYNRGGDMVFECWDEQFYNEYICMFGPISEKQALQLFETNYYIQQDIEKA